MDGDQAETRPVPVGVPRCAVCGRVLPPQGRARPRKYCPDGDGRYVEQGVECRELGPAQEMVRRVHGGPVPDLDLDRLAEQVDAVLAVFGGAGPVEGLRTGLRAVTEQLEHTVAAAIRTRSAAQDAARGALAQAAADEHRREAAEGRAEQAAAAEKDAERVRDQAEQARQAAEAARQAARRDQVAAEAGRAEQAARADRSDAAAARDRQRTEDAVAQVSTLTERVVSLQERCQQADLRAEAEGARAEQVRAEAAVEVRRVLDRSSDQVEALRVDAAATAQRHTTAVVTAERRSATELAERDRRLGEAEAAVEELRRTTRAGLRRLLRTGSATTDDAAPDPTPREHLLHEGLVDLITELGLEPGLAPDGAGSPQAAR